MWNSFTESVTILRRFNIYLIVLSVSLYFYMRRFYRFSVLFFLLILFYILILLSFHLPHCRIVLPSGVINSNKARSATVDRRVRQTIRDVDEAERIRCPVKPRSRPTGAARQQGTTMIRMRSYRQGSSRSTVH